jgi:hypothetical protein
MHTLERRKYIALACNCHLSVEWDFVEFGVDNPKRLADDLNSKGTKFTGDEPYTSARIRGCSSTVHHPAHP